MEFIVIVAGILAALGVDGWRLDREELRRRNGATVPSNGPSLTH